MILTSKRTGLAALAAAFLLLLPAASHSTVIGIVYPECCTAYDTAVKALKTELARGGFGAGDAEIYEQKPSADPMSWSNAFRKFVGVDADLIVVFGDDMLEVACREKTRIPILFGFVGDPERFKCIKAMDSPGGNVTGVGSRALLFTLLDSAGKVKGCSSLGVFDLEGDPVSAAHLREIEGLAGELGARVTPISSPRREDLATALEGAPPPDLLFLPSFAVGTAGFAAILNAASNRRIPTVSLRPSEAGQDILLSLHPNPDEQGKLMGEMAVRLLKGESPGKMKIQNPRNIEFVVDMGTARKLGLKVPMSVLETATSVRK